MGAIKKVLSSSFPLDVATGQRFGCQFKETGYGSRRKLVIEFKDCVLPLTDNAGVGGQACFKIGELPLEIIQFGAMRANMTATRNSGSTTSLSDTFDADIGLGTTTGIGAALATTEQDIFQTQAVPQAVAGVATLALTQAATSALYDATTAKDLYFNFLVDDADQDATALAATIKFNGTITMFYDVLGA